MAKNRGWWSLKLEGNHYDELEDWDLEHIAEQIKKGCHGGEIVKDGED